MIAYWLSNLASPASGYAVIDPYAENGAIIMNPVFDSFFIDQLYSENKIPVLNNGSVEFYIAKNESCHAMEGEICAAVPCGVAICGSKKFAESERFGNETAKNIIENALVSGNKEVHDAISAQNALRYEALEHDNPQISQEYLSMIEKNIAQRGGSTLDEAYLRERYNFSVASLINQEIMGEAELGDAKKMLKKGDVDSAIADIDEYFSKNYNISPAFDARDIFGAVKNKQIGPAQYSEILMQMLRQSGINEPLGALINKSGILNDTINKNAFESALEEIAKNPELFDSLKKSMDLLDDKMFNDIISKALEESFKNKDMLKKYLDMLPDILNNEKMRNFFLKASAEAIRKMQETGELSKLLDNLGDSAIKEKIMNAAKDSAPSIIDGIEEKIKKSIKPEYTLPLFALMAILIVSLMVRL